MASTALLKADFVSLGRSWVLRGWLVALVLSVLFALSSTLNAARSTPVPASAILTITLSGFLLVWSTFIIVLSAGSVSLEADIVSDSILSRACTRSQYIVSKLLSRGLVVSAAYLVASLSTAYCAWRWGANDLTVATTAAGIGIVWLAVLLLVNLGVTLSVICNNTVVSVVALLLLWYVASPVTAFLGAEYLSPASLVLTLPQILRDPHAPRIVECTARPSSISVSFSKRMDPVRAEELSNYAVESPAGSTVVAAIATYDAARTTVVLTGVTLTEGAAVRVSVRGLTDTGGSALAPGADVVNTTVADDTEVSVRALARGAAAKRLSRGDHAAPRVLSCTATSTSVKVVFSEPLERATAEDIANYVVENPVGNARSVRAAAYRASDRSVLLTGISLEQTSTVKVTATKVEDLAGNPVSPQSNSAIYNTVSVLKYVLGLALPALIAAIVGIVWFGRRDL